VSILSDLVSLLSLYVEDAMPVPEAEVQQFTSVQNILLRDDHKQFLMRFFSGPNRRLHLFKSYKGDFEFWMFKSVYLDEKFSMVLPPGCAYFGSSFVGTTLCVEYESGSIFEYDEDEKYGMVHECIDGFLMRGLLLAYDEVAFSSKVVIQWLEQAEIDAFEAKNEQNKIARATTFSGRAKTVDNPKRLVEYYLVDGKLIYLFFPMRTMVELSGGVLTRL